MVGVVVATRYNINGGQERWGNHPFAQASVGLVGMGIFVGK